MLTVAIVSKLLEEFAPARLAEEWDNVGLLVGGADWPAGRIMTCLTLTAASVAEAVQERAELVVAHHPLPFRPLKRITTESAEGRLLLELAAARISVYSPHTAFDSAGRGINQRLAEGLQLLDIEPLIADDVDPAIGTGRIGRLAAGATLGELAGRIATLVHIGGLQLVGDAARPVDRVAVGCGSAGELLAAAAQRGADCFVTGEARFHTCLEAESLGMTLVLAGHYASERFAVEQLADALATEFAAAHVWASRREHDPLSWFSPTCPSP